ncbi:MAG: cytochrome P450 [Mycobacteriales bacterium]
MLVTELDLPSYDHIDATLSGDAYHAALDEVAQQSWIAKGVMGFAILERDAGNEVLRDKRFAFPAMELLMLQGVTSGPIWDRNAEGLMVQTDDAHARLRRLLMPAFTPRATERLRPMLRALITELWDPVADTGECEFVSTLAEPLPSRAIAALLDCPGDAPLLSRWSFLLQEVFKMRLDQVAPEVEKAYEEMRAYVHAKLALRRAAPGEDLISVIGTSELSDDECVTLVGSVISGGTDTTQAQLAHGLRLFADHPDQWELLARDPSLIHQAVEEVLRFEPITPFTARIAREDVEVNGTVIPEGTVLFVCAATANRDPAAFEHPQTFDITRKREAAPMTFGFGAHFCIGHNLARAELAETFTYLAPRTPGLRINGEVKYGPVTGIYGLDSLPLAWSTS